MPDIADWKPAQVDLTYRLGEIKLFALTLSGYALRRHFTALETFSALPCPSAESVPAAEFYFYPCYPVSFEPARIGRVNNWIIYTPYTFENSYVDLQKAGSFAEYLKQFSSKTRSTLLRKVRKFEEASGGAADWRSYTQPAQFDEFFRLAGPLSDRTYQAKLLESGLPHDTEFVNSAKKDAETGGAIGFLLFFEAKPVAYVFCFRREGVVTYDYVGFDPNRADMSPGTILQYFIMQFLFEEGQSRIFDFTEGEGGHKRLFGRESQRCAKSYVLRGSIRNTAMLQLHLALISLSETIGTILDRFGLRERIRAFIRSNA